MEDDDDYETRKLYLGFYFPQSATIWAGRKWRFEKQHQNMTRGQTLPMKWGDEIFDATYIARGYNKRKVEAALDAHYRSVNNITTTSQKTPKRRADPDKKQREKKKRAASVAFQPNAERSRSLRSKRNVSYIEVSDDEEERAIDRKRRREEQEAENDEDENERHIRAKEAALRAYYEEIRDGVHTSEEEERASVTYEETDSEDDVGGAGRDGNQHRSDTPELLSCGPAAARVHLEEAQKEVERAERAAELKRAAKEAAVGEELEAKSRLGKAREHFQRRERIIEAAREEQEERAARQRECERVEKAERRRKEIEYAKRVDDYNRRMAELSRKADLNRRRVEEFSRQEEAFIERKAEYEKAEAEKHERIKAAKAKAVEPSPAALVPPQEGTIEAIVIDDNANIAAALPKAGSDDGSDAAVEARKESVKDDSAKKLKEAEVAASKTDFTEATEESEEVEKLKEAAAVDAIKAANAPTAVERSEAAKKLDEAAAAAANKAVIAPVTTEESEEAKKLKDAVVVAADKPAIATAAEESEEIAAPDDPSPPADTTKKGNLDGRADAAHMTLADMHAAAGAKLRELVIATPSIKGIGKHRDPRRRSREEATTKTLTGAAASLSPSEIALETTITADNASNDEKVEKIRIKPGTVSKEGGGHSDMGKKQDEQMFVAPFTPTPAVQTTPNLKELIGSHVDDLSLLASLASLSSATKDTLRRRISNPFNAVMRVGSGEGNESAGAYNASWASSSSSTVPLPYPQLPYQRLPYPHDDCTVQPGYYGETWRTGSGTGDGSA